jgi:NhaP-type Na+/H+ or K+/H+ antiporter
MLRRSAPSALSAAQRSVSGAVPSAVVVDVLTLLALSGLMTLMLGLLSGLLRRCWLTTPIVSLALGFVIGPFCFGLIDERLLDRPGVIREICEITLAFSVMAAAAGLPWDFYRRYGPSILVLLTAVMGAMWLVSAGLAWAVLGLGLLPALLLGAIVTPTDPVLSTTVFTSEVAKKAVPQGVRRSVYAESGANDGLAVLFVTLPAALLARGSDEGSVLGAIGTWAADGMLREVLGGLVLGAAFGAAAGLLQRRAVRAGLAEPSAVLPVLLGLTLAVFGVGRLLGVSAVLGCFCAGVVFHVFDHDELEEKEQRAQDAVEQFLQPPGFIVLGVVLPIAAWQDAGWRLLAFVVLVLLLRRLPAVLLLRRFMPALRRRRDGLFAGWFGPIGIAAVYYTARLAEEGGRFEWAWPCVTALVTASIVVHGVSGTPFARMMVHRAGA